MDQQTLWQSVLTELRLNLSGANYQTWFKGKTQIISLQENLVEIGCQSAFVRDWLEQRYYQQIKLSLDRLLEKNTSLVFSVSAASEKISVKKTSKPLPNTHLLFDEEGKSSLQERVTQANLNPNYTFENFIVGGSNELAHAVASSVAKKLGTPYNPYFIYGGVGVGKTHLMQAVGNRVLSLDSNKKVLYLTSERFTNDLIESIQSRKTPSFRNRYRNLDLLLIDDVQFIAGRESTQEEFFHTFNALHAAGKQIVLTSDQPPQAIRKLEERLRSRFEGGMMADIQTPTVDLREAILLSKCAQQGEHIGPEILRFIAQTCDGSVRDLEGCLVQLITRARVTNSPYSLNLAKQVLGQRFEKGKPLGSKKVLSTVAKYFEIKLTDLTGISRQEKFVAPRQIAMYLLRKDLMLPLERIAAELNRKDHTTVLHAVEKISRLVDNDSRMRSWLFDLRQQMDLG